MRAPTPPETVTDQPDISDILAEIESGWSTGDTPESTERSIRDAARIAQRDALIARLDREGEDDHADRLRKCGSRLSLTCTCCGDLREVRQTCKLRWCPVCAWRIAAARTARYSAAVASMQWPLFLTLTQRNVSVLSLDTIRHMRRALRRMRQRKWWAESVRGGVASIEITNTGRGWHPHIHAVIDCRWLSVRTPPPRPLGGPGEVRAKLKQSATEVAAAWAHALGHPRATVKIKRAYGSGRLADPTGRSKSIVHEVLKYACKPADLIDSPDPIGPILTVLAKARLVSGWGSCYGDRLIVDEPTREPSACSCGAIGAWIPTDLVDGYLRSCPSVG